MYFSLEISIVLTIIAAAMWGSWMQIVKHLKGYPIEGVVFWLYAFSFVLVWTVTCAAAPFLLEDGVFSLIVKHRKNIVCRGNDVAGIVLQSRDYKVCRPDSFHNNQWRSRNTARSCHISYGGRNAGRRACGNPSGTYNDSLYHGGIFKCLRFKMQR